MSSKRTKSVKLRAYQKRLYENIQRKLRKKDSTVLLAATTGAGKTNIAIKFIQDKKDKKFLVLTHGTQVLRDNFMSRLLENNYLAEDEVFEVEGSRSLKDRNKQKRVWVALPQSVHRIAKELKQFDYLIVDEAHQFYSDAGDKKMYNKILKYFKGRTILLTASHYRLAAPKVFFSREEAFKNKCLIVDAKCEIVPDNQDFQDSDYNEKGELKESAWRSRSNLGKTTHERIYQAIKGRYPALISCDSIKAAENLSKYLQKQVGLKPKGRKKQVAVSNIKTDYSSSNLEEFKNGKYKVCIVVNRGRLGFDYPDLQTFVDVTYSMNPETVEQSYGRVCRKNPNDSGRNDNKRFVKMAPQKGWEQYWLVMTAVMALGESEEYQNWDGKFKNARCADGKKAVGVVSEAKSNGKKDRSGAEGAAYPRLELTFGMFKKMFKQDKEVYKTTLRDALTHVKNIKNDSPWLVCRSAEELAKWVRVNVDPNSSQDWKNRHASSYCIAQKQHWLGKICYEIFEWKRKHNPAENKEEIKRWMRENKKYPSETAKKDPEKRLGRLLSNYTSQSDSAYDPEFDKEIKQLAKELGIKRKRNPAENKEEIKRWMRENKKYPSATAKKYPSQTAKDDSEKRLGVLLSSYTNPKRKSYDPDFTKEIKQLAKELDIKRKRNPAENKEGIKQWMRENLKYPNQKTKKDPEKRLGRLLSNYTRPKSKSYDPDFTKEIEQLAKALGIKRRCNRPILCIETGIVYKSANDAAKQLNLYKSAISKVLSGKQKSTKGYTFKYVEEESD